MAAPHKEDYTDQNISHLNPMNRGAQQVHRVTELEATEET